MEEPALLRSVKRSPTAYAVDDAGTRLREVRLGDLPVAEGDAGAAMRRFVKQLRRAASNEGSASARGQLVVAGLTIGTLVAWSLLQSRVPMGTGTIFAVMGLLLVLSWEITRRVGLGIQREGIARTIVSRGYCGGCGYDLRATIGTRSRFAECSECGARWSPGLVGSVPFGATEWDQLGTGSGRAPVSVPLASDDRGVLVRRIRSVSWRVPRSARRSWTSAQRKSVRLARRRNGLVVRSIVVLIGVLLLAGLGLLLVPALLDVGIAPATGLLPLVVLPIVVVIVTAVIGETGVVSRRFARAVRDSGICPCCSLGLDNARSDEAGLRVCQRCGAGWRAEADS
ncbi:MAG: hypothetical protein AAF937_10980 [Planctomycetota bacterium]